MAEATTATSGTLAKSEASGAKSETSGAKSEASVAESEASRVKVEASGQPIPFNDLQAQRRRLGGAIEEAVGRVMEHGRFILGPEVGELENRLAEFAGQAHAVTCSSGTDALALAFMAWEIGQGDAVFVPSFTFAATAGAVARLGATPVFCDVLEDSFNLDPNSFEAAIETARGLGLRPKVVVPVDLYGLPADYDRIVEIAGAQDILVLADSAQSFGATLDGRRTGTLGDACAVSFFPAKPLGCYGDGGAVLTADAEMADRLRSLRAHGGGRDKYDNVRIGLNARLDTIQAAILLKKLDVFAEELDARQRVAARYSQRLEDLVEVPGVPGRAVSAWAQYTIRLNQRDAVADRLRQSGIPTAVYYPLPLNRQQAFLMYPSAPGGTPVADRLAEQVLSLPMHPYLDEPTQDRVVDALHRSLNG